MKLNIKIWSTYFLLVFPLFYFVYKYGTPDLGLRDFYDYYKMYANWDLENTEAPFNMRLVSTFFVHLMYKAGIRYETQISFDALGMDRAVFFNAILFNFICVISTCLVIFRMIHNKFKSTLLSFCAGLLYPLGFGTMFYELMPITDAFSLWMFALIFHWYLQKKQLVIVPLLLLIFQREYIFLALGLLCVLDYWKQRDLYFVKVLAASILCFATYFILRKTLFYTPKYDQQADPGYFLESIVTLKFPLLPYIKQTFMTMNIFILYILVVLYKKYKRMAIDSFSFIKLILLFAQINIISFAAVFGNNTGRYFYILVPAVIYYLVIETQPLIKDEKIGSIE
jgi:hypothetical protein